MTVILLLGSSRAAALGKRIGARIPLALGAAIAAVGVALLLRVGAGSTYWADVFGPIVLTGLGLTLLVAPLTSTVLAAAPTPLAGVASGINNAVARSGSLLAVAALPLAAGLSGTDYSNPVAFNHGYRIAIAACAGLLVVSAAAVVVPAAGPQTPRGSGAGTRGGNGFVAARGSCRSVVGGRQDRHGRVGAATDRHDQLVANASATMARPRSRVSGGITSGGRKRRMLP